MAACIPPHAQSWKGHCCLFYFGNLSALLEGSELPHLPSVALSLEAVHSWLKKSLFLKDVAFANTNKWFVFVSASAAISDF